MNTYDITCQQDAALQSEADQHRISNGYCPKCNGDLETVTVTETTVPFTFQQCECGWDNA